MSQGLKSNKQIGSRQLGKGAGPKANRVGKGIGSGNRGRSKQGLPATSKRKS